MANKTTNYNLAKPLQTEFYDISIQNENMDKIDLELKKANSAVGLKAPLASPTFTGIPTTVTPLNDTNNEQIVNISWLNYKLQQVLYNSELKGVPTAPTPTTTDNSTKVATTAYVKSAISDLTDIGYLMSGIREESNQYIVDVAYGKGVYMAAGVDRILKSADGVTWTAVKPISGSRSSAMYAIYGGGCFAFYGEGKTYITQDNGMSFAEYTHASYMTSAAYGDGKIMLMSQAGGGHLIDCGVLTRTAVNGSAKDIAYFKGSFYSIKSGDTKIYKYNMTNDTWEPISVATATAYDRIISCNGYLCLYPTAPLNVMWYSLDGVTFEPMAICDTLQNPVQDMYCIAGKYIVVTQTKLYVSYAVHSAFVWSNYLAPKLPVKSSCQTDNYIYLAE